MVEQASWLPTGPAGTGWWMVLGLVLGCGACAGWRLMPTRSVVTVFHELGHALAGLVVGAKVSGIRLRWNTSGTTEWSYAGTPGRLRRSWVAWWGYPTPPLIGVVGTWCVAGGHARWWLLALAGATVVMGAAWVRNPWGVVVCATAGAALGMAAWAATPVPAVAGAEAAAVLVLGGGLSILEHRQHGASSEADAAVVARALFLPAAVVRASFVFVAVLTLASAVVVVLTTMG